MFSKKREFFQSVYVSRLASWLRPPPCPDGAKAQLVRCLLGNVSLAPGCESKVTGEGDKDALLHLGATPKPISTKAGWSTRHQAHTELGKLHPQARLWAPPTGTGSWSLAPRLQKSRPDVRWVFTCYKFLHIKKKKNSTRQDGKLGLSTSEPCSRAHSLGVERASTPFHLLGQQTLPAPRPSVSKPRCRSSVRGRRQKGLRPGKEDTFVVGSSPCFHQREYKLLCAQTRTVVLKKRVRPWPGARLARASSG